MKQNILREITLSQRKFEKWHALNRTHVTHLTRVVISTGTSSAVGRLYQQPVYRVVQKVFNCSFF